MMKEIRVCLPEKMNLVVGDTFQLFFRGVVEAPDPFCYDILAVCEKGRNYPRYFEYLPEEEGQHELTISVYDADKTLLGQAKTLLCVTAPVSPKKPVNVLCVGDSLTAGGEWPREAYRRLTSVDGRPKGDGLSNVRFIGTCGDGEVGYEGYGGWRWESYFPAGMGNVWVVCWKHSLGIEDQHSLWKDENGNIWQLETIAAEYLKFTRYLQHEGPMPSVGSKLTPYRNVVHETDVEVESISQEKKSPFFDEETKQIDFKSYCRKHEYDGIDVVYVFLGSNGRVEAYVAGWDLEQQCTELVKKGKEFVRLLRRDYPNAKVRVMGLLLSSVNGGVGTSYGAQLPCCDDYGTTCFVLALNKAYEAWTKEPEYADFMEFVNISAQFDVDYNMPSMPKPVNTRSKQMEVIGTNGAHPLEEGYLQIADAVYRDLVHVLKGFCD